MNVLRLQGLWREGQGRSGKVETVGGATEPESLARGRCQKGGSEGRKRRKVKKGVSQGRRAGETHFSSAQEQKQWGAGWGDFHSVSRSAVGSERRRDEHLPFTPRSGQRTLDVALGIRSGMAWDVDVDCMGGPGSKRDPSAR